MRRKGSQYLLVTISILTLTFLIAISFNISPLLRGPAPYPPEWQWAYLPVFSVTKSFAPLIVLAGILFSFRAVDNTTLWGKKEIIILSILFSLTVLFALSIIYFSRSGLGVLLHRIINPELNGYFTSATTIRDIPLLLRTYPAIVLKLAMHAQGHPPGAILFFRFLIDIVAIVPGFTSIGSSIIPATHDVAKIWNMLTPAEKTTALISPIVVQLLSSLTLFPLYFCTKIMYGQKIAFRAAFLYAFLPNVILFLPINDVFLPLFTATALFFLVHGLKTKALHMFILSGITIALGLFFSLSLLPVLAILILFFFLRKPNDWIRFGLGIASGLVLPYTLLLFFFHYEALGVALTVMSGLPENRDYLTWVFYNLYDFFIFSGIAISSAVLMTIPISYSALKKRSLKLLPLLPFSFLSILFLLTLSGSVRGEVGRIWLPFAPFMAICAAYFLTKKTTLSTRTMLIILGLQGIQVIVMQAVWVMLW